MLNDNRKMFIVLLTLVVVFSGYWIINSLYSTNNLLVNKVQEPTDEELLEDEKSQIAQQLGQYNILILGLDSQKGFTARADAIMLATIDTKSRQARLISIPRDTRVKIKGGWDKVNAAYAYGGVDLARETVEDFLDVEINRHVVLNFNSLIQIVDAIGGVEVDVPSRMYYPDENINLRPGLQVLNGEDALAYSRFRNDNQGDIGQAKRQQEIMQLVAKKVFSFDGLKNLPSLVNIALDNVKTDVPLREILALAKLAPDILENQVVSIVVPGRNQRIDGLWYWNPDLKELEQQLKIVNNLDKIAKENTLETGNNI